MDAAEAELLFTLFRGPYDVCMDARVTLNAVQMAGGRVSCGRRQSPASRRGQMNTKAIRPEQMHPKNGLAPKEARENAQHIHVPPTPLSPHSLASTHQCRISIPFPAFKPCLISSRDAAFPGVRLPWTSCLLGMPPPLECAFQNHASYRLRVTPSPECLFTPCQTCPTSWLLRMAPCSHAKLAGPESCRAGSCKALPFIQAKPCYGPPCGTQGAAIADVASLSLYYLNMRKTLPFTPARPCYSPPCATACLWHAESCRLCWRCRTICNFYALPTSPETQRPKACAAARIRGVMLLPLATGSYQRAPTSTQHPFTACVTAPAPLRGYHAWCC